MQRILAFYDSDSSYATRFAELFRNQRDLEFDVSVFTRTELLMEFLTSTPVDVLLLGEAILIEEDLLEQVRYVYCMTGSPLEKCSEGFVPIYKYRTAKTVIREIIADYTKKECTARKEQQQSASKTISVFSPASHSGHVLFAYSLAQMSAEHRNTLFIVLEPYPVPVIPALIQQEHPLADFLYHLKENAQSSSIRQYLIMDGPLMILSGIQHAMDIQVLNREDIRHWKQLLLQDTSFECIIFCYSGLGEAYPELMAISDEVYLVAREEAFDRAMLEEWMIQQQRMGEPISNDRYHTVFMKSDQISQVPMSIDKIRQSRSWQTAAELQIT